MSKCQCQQQRQRYSCSDDEMSCKICLTVYSQQSYGQRPRTLHCRHTFCESCIQHLITEGRRQRKGRAEGSTWSVKCPLCKFRTYLGPTSIQELPVNPTAIKHSGQMSDLRGHHCGRQLCELQPRCATKDVKCKKGKPKIHFMSGETTGTRVAAQRCHNFHPPPDDDERDIWEQGLSPSNGQVLRFADDDTLSSEIEHGCHISCSPTRDLEDPVNRNDEVFEDLTPCAVFVGQFGRYEGAPDGRAGTCRSPSSIDCACDGRLAIVDAETGSVQISARNGDCLSSFRVVGAQSACFIDDAARGELLAVATNSGVSICDLTGRVDKYLPVGTDVVAVAALRHGGGVFAAAHRNRITICDRYKPTAVLRSLSSVRPLNALLGQSGMQFGNIVALATTATPRLYVVDGAAVLAVDVDTGTLLQSIETRLLCQPNAVAVDMVTGSVLVADSTTQRVMQFDADGDRRRCAVELANDDGRCVALAAGSRAPDGHQLVYVVCRGVGFSEVRMYQI